MLFRSIAIENPLVQFSFIIPATVEGNFRASAVDGGPIRENTSDALPQGYVAEQVVRAVDTGNKMLFLPSTYWFIHAISWLLPSVVERGAKRKYGFK